MHNLVSADCNDIESAGCLLPQPLLHKILLGSADNAALLCFINSLPRHTAFLSGTILDFHKYHHPVLPGYNIYLASAAVKVLLQNPIASRCQILSSLSLL